MGIDLKKMRAKMNALENKGGKNIFWRPEDGETTIRLVPTADGDPFKEYWFHYNVGNNPGFLSPKKTKASRFGATARWRTKSCLA